MHLGVHRTLCTCRLQWFEEPLGTLRRLRRGRKRAFRWPQRKVLQEVTKMCVPGESADSFKHSNADCKGNKHRISPISLRCNIRTSKCSHHGSQDFGLHPIHPRHNQPAALGESFHRTEIIRVFQRISPVRIDKLQYSRRPQPCAEQY